MTRGCKDGHARCRSVFRREGGCRGVPLARGRRASYWSGARPALHDHARDPRAIRQPLPRPAVGGRARPEPRRGQGRNAGARPRCVRVELAQEALDALRKQIGEEKLDVRR